MKDKSEASTIFKQYHKFIQNVFQSSIQYFASIMAYMSSDLTQYLCDHGILHQTLCAYTSRQNGLAETKNRHLLEVAHLSMFASHVPNSF